MLAVIDWCANDTMRLIKNKKTIDTNKIRCSDLNTMTNKRIPAPVELLAEANKLPDTVELAEYVPVMWKLKSKGLSLRETAAWLSERLPIVVTHTQVLRLLKSSTISPDERAEFREENYEEESALVRKELDEAAAIEATRVQNRED